MYATATANARQKFVNDGVGNTPPERLLVMLYDRLLRDLDDATVAIGVSDIGGAHEALTHAQDIVAELHSALDTDRWDGAEAMAGLYIWLGELLAQANVKKSAALVDEARSLVQPMRDTWNEACQALAMGSASSGIAAPTEPTAYAESGLGAGRLDVSG